jgi:hypothetical protein
MAQQSNIVNLGFSGIPYVSENYKGEKHFSERAKAKRSFQKIGEIKRLYIDANTGSGNVSLDISSSIGSGFVDTEICKIINAISNSPMGMIKFSWEQPFLGTKPEKDCFLPYKSWLFQHYDGSHSEIKARHQEKLDFEQMIHTLEYKKHLEETELKDLWDEWELRCEMDDILTSSIPDYIEIENAVIQSKKRSFDTMILEFDSDDDDSDDETQAEYQLVETFTPVSGKTDFTIEEICEHIRMLSVTGGKTELSVDKLTEYFGQKREYKKVPKRCVSPDIYGNGFVQRELPLHRRKVEDEPVVVKVDLNEVLDLEFPKLALN